MFRRKSDNETKVVVIFIFRRDRDDCIRQFKDTVEHVDFISLPFQDTPNARRVSITVEKTSIKVDYVSIIVTVLINLWPYFLRVLVDATILFQDTINEALLNLKPYRRRSFKEIEVHQTLCILAVDRCSFMQIPVHAISNHDFRSLFRHELTIERVL